MRSFLNRIWLDYRLQLARKNSLSLLILLLLLSLGFYPLPEDGYVTFRVSGVIGQYNSVWMAVIYSMMTSMLVMLFGFYFIKGAISSDRKQNLGSLFAHTPIANWHYILQKTVASFLVLVSICFVSLLTTLCLNLFMYNQFPFELATYIGLFTVVLLPLLFLCAAFTSLFDSHPKLSGTFGNILYFFLYTGMLASLGGGLLGFSEISNQIELAIQQSYPNLERGGVSIGMLIDSPENLKAHPSILLSGLSLNSHVYFESTFVILFALLVVAIATIAFDRFKYVPENAANNSNQTVYLSKLLTRLRERFPASANMRLLLTEISLLTRGMPKFVWAGILVLNISIIALISNDIGKLLIGLLCMLNITVLGKLGIREEKAQLGLLLNHFSVSYSSRLTVQIVAALTVVLGTQVASVVWVFAQYGPLSAMSLILGISLWVLLSFVVGPWFRQRHPFDLMFLFTWYLGPMNGFAAIDFLSIHSATSLQGFGLLLCILACLAGLLAARTHLTEQRRLV